MDCIEVGPRGLLDWSVGACPKAEDARPPACRRCGALAKVGDRIVLHGHGHPCREVVVAPWLGGPRAEPVECWTRRYLCTECGGTMTVTPQGILARYLYSVSAIVSALFMVEAGPIGDGQSHPVAYERQGMHSAPWSLEPERWRWRSLGRWAKRAAEWWPSHASGDVGALLLSLLERSGAGGREGALEVAVRTHAQWGKPM